MSVASALTDRDRLRDKVVVVTGAAQGIGAAYARRLASEGSRLAITDVIEDRLKLLADELGSVGSDVLSEPTDVTEEDAVTALFDRAVERFGRIDGLINNAGIYFGLKPVESPRLDRRRWERTMSVNVWGTFLCTFTAAERMKSTGGGSIVNVSSSTAYFGAPMMADYTASKGAVISLSRSLAREYGPQGVRVNVIAPGGTWTEASAELFGVGPDADPAVLRKNQIQQQSIRRQQAPEDLTGTACYLLSDDSAMVTGQVLVVDGGHVFI